MASAKVLVIDDDESIVDLVSTYLTREGFHVDFARDGTAGRGLARLPDRRETGMVVVPEIGPQRAPPRSVRASARHARNPRDRGYRSMAVRSARDLQSNTTATAPVRTTKPPTRTPPAGRKKRAAVVANELQMKTRRFGR